MNEIVKLINFCFAFKHGELDVHEFQDRLTTVYLPDECKYTLEIVLYNSHNKLEEIIFRFKESQQKHAEVVADELLNAALFEKNRLYSKRQF